MDTVGTAWGRSTTRCTSARWRSEGLAQPNKLNVSLTILRDTLLFQQRFQGRPNRTACEADLQKTKQILMKPLITTLTALALGATLSFAQEKPPGAPPGGGGGGQAGGGEGGRRERPNPEEAFKKLDTNNDGSVNLDEFKAGPMAQRNPERAEEAFKRMDKNSDGKLSLEEFKTGRPPRPGGGAEGGGGGGRRGGPGGPGGRPPAGQ